MGYDRKTQPAGLKFGLKPVKIIIPINGTNAVANECKPSKR